MEENFGVDRDRVVRITGRWQGTEPASAVTLTLPWSLRQRSRFRARLDDGRDAGVWMPRGEILRDRDRLHGEGGLCIEVRAAAEEVAVAHPRSRMELARACYHLGNRHTPLQITPGAGAVSDTESIQFQPDHVLEDMLRELGVPVRHERRPFDPEAGAYAGGAHAHSHAHRHDSDLDAVRGDVSTDAPGRGTTRAGG